MVIKKEHILLLLLCCMLLFSCTSTDKKIDKHSNKNVEQENKNNKNEEELLEKDITCQFPEVKKQSQKIVVKKLWNWYQIYTKMQIKVLH